MSRSSVVVQGDARRLPLADNSVHAVVCDPPYGLEFMGKEWDRPAAMWATRDAREDNLPIRPKGGNNPFLGAKLNRYVAGRAFQAWCEEWATEALRVLRPGGWLLAFGSPRTWHRLTCGIEDAGFELRDQVAEFYAGGDAMEAPPYGPLAWTYGSGFPPSQES